ncbi:succinylglutamate desuccinylase/aspartoacylase domain-containing protein [Halosegnis longus]|uniref:Succinylglutamate desuccinylase n=1 Tax=Halosegnis longus TaxID=2216012 RepID=A0AAJ4R8V2_9EURY|nr:succinylglutamate desuccinylase/aspartoacylase family protein [Halosegnis longus]RNJ26350.1 succinylglutamate desuccinylase [Salella cibi]
MRVEQLGEGTPEIAVVGSIHGDEPCGARAVERLLAESPTLDRPVKFVIANERALAENVRYVDEDLNRAFPGDPDADTHEGRLAHELTQELRDSTIFSMHSTQSYAAPFALVDELDPLAASVVPYLTVEALIETVNFSEGRLIESQDVIEVECGLQGSERAAENAYDLTRQFLGAVGAIEPPQEPRDDVPVFRMERMLPKPPAREYETFVTNFERVAEGETYARADDELFVADRPFYPILLSPYGYETEFGYTGDLVGRLDEQAIPGPEPTPER